MSFVERRLDSGLVLANEAMDEHRVGRALKQLDDRLVLQKHRRDGVEGGFVYKVVCVVSDRYAPIVFTWADAQGRPLPLSSGLVDDLQRHMVGARNPGLGVDEHNRRLLDEKRRDHARESEALRGDHAARLVNGRVTVALGLGKPRYWRRASARPRSSGL